jgi:hypothetical protein
VRVADARCGRETAVPVERVGRTSAYMRLTDLLRLPPGALLGFALLMWPAVWATFLIIAALAGDLIRQAKSRPDDVWHKAA